MNKDHWRQPNSGAFAFGCGAGRLKSIACPLRGKYLQLIFGLVCLLAAGLWLPSRASAQVLLDAPAPAANNITSMDALDDQQKLGTGDRVSYRVIEDKEETKSLVVSDTGELDVPYLGRVKAAEKTCKTLAREIQKALTNELYYKATVIVAVDLLNKKRGSVYLYGHIKNNGPQDIPSDEILTLTKAIMRAGGFTDFADKKKVKLSRPVGGTGNNNKIEVIDTTEIFEKGKTEKDLKLQAGDVIYVPSRMVNL
jgi:protein involved in polysaccharide export with SLBB domain